MENLLRTCFALSLVCGTLNAFGQTTSVPVYSDMLLGGVAGGRQVAGRVGGVGAKFRALEDIDAAGNDQSMRFGHNCTPFWTVGTYPQGSVTVPYSIVDLDIDLSGSELDFNAPIIGIWILEAQRIRMRNFTVDWPKLPIASLGSIVADPDNPGHHALVLDPEYAVTDPYQSRTVPDRAGPVQIQAVDIWDGTKETEDRLGIVDPPGTFDPKSNMPRAAFERYTVQACGTLSP